MLIHLKYRNIEKERRSIGNVLAVVCAIGVLERAQCFEGLRISSDGKGGMGNKGDCGYVEPILGGDYKPD